MVFVQVVSLLLVVFFSAIFLGRFFAKVVEFLARYFANLDLSIDTFGLLSVRGIKIRLKGKNYLVIEKISLKTKWTYSNSRKLFTILFGKTEFLQDFSGQSQEMKPKVKTKPLSSFAHKERVSQIINLFCQYVAICFSDVCLVLLFPQDRQVKCQLQNGLEFIANPAGTCLNSILTAENIVAVITAVNDRGAMDTLAKFTAGLEIDSSLQPLQGIGTADLQVTLNSVQGVLNDALLAKTSTHPASKTASLTQEDVDTSNIQPPSSDLSANELWLQLAKVPKQAELHIDRTSITLISRQQRKLTLDISHIASIFQCKKDEIDSVNQCDINLVISGVKASGIDSCELCSLNRLRFSSKLSEHDGSSNLGASLSVESFHNNYVHNECMYWMEYFKSRLHERKAHPETAQPIERSHSRLYNFNLPVKMDLEMIDCSTCLFLTHERPDQPLCRAVLASFIVNADIPAKGIGDLVSDNQEIRLVTRLDNAYIYFDALKTLPEQDEITSYTLLDHPSLLPHSNSHVWGRTLALGSCALKCDVGLPLTHGKATHVQLKGEANCLALEWSHQVYNTLLHLTKQFTLGVAPTQDKPQPPSATSTQDKGEQHTETPPKSTFSIDSEISLRGVNAFYLGTQQNGVDSFVYRTDIVTMKNSYGNPVVLDLYGVTISRLVGLKKAPYKCLQSGDLANQCVSVPSIKVSVTRDKVISVTLEDTLVEWTPTLHMALNDRIQEVTQDAVTLKDMLFQGGRQPGEKEALQKGHQEEMDSQRTTAGPQTVVCVKCGISRLKLQMETSPSTSFGVELSNSSVSFEGGDVSVAMDTAVVLFDDNHTFTFKAVTLQRSLEVEEITTTRKCYPTLQTQNNIAWIISAKESHVFFPYGFDFASSRSELVSVAKMLKTLHKKPRDPGYIGPLPPDLWLRFEKIIFEIEDDPFEVKLGANYTLLMDEAKQWSDRMETLQNRLNTIRMTPGNLLTVEKEILLRKKLLEKNAELYIQRSKAFFEENYIHKGLLVWELQGLDLQVLADESYHGRHKAVEMMARLNTESPLPESDISFSTLWCRTVKGRLESHCCKLRNYPQPIFTSKQIKLSGTFLAAEQTAKTHAQYDSSIVVEQPWDNVVVQRSLTALKYYYDLDLDVDTLELAWGVDTEPGLAMVSLAFERLSKPSKDPSKPLPFYDKIRLLLHGRLHMNIQKWLMFFSAARNPYETTERMEVDWLDVDLLWTNGRIEILGDFDLQTRTASRYDDRQVLHFPAFKVCADMAWNCIGNPNDHFSVMPFAPSKLPELAPNQAHDSYAAFRSQSLTLNLSLEIAMDKTTYGSQKGPPYVFLYASTFRWFKKYQEVVLRYTSRPIKRGNYFNRIQQKKKTLGRHYKKVSLSLKFPELSIWYWGSFSQQRGFEMKCGSGSLQTQYRLALRPFDGGLTRRPAADWSATKLHIEIKKITCHLYGLEQADGQEEGEEAEDVSSIDLEPTKYYFLTAESLEYSRQDSSKQQHKVDESEPDSQSYNHQLVCHGSKGVWTLTNRRIIFGLFEAYTNAELLKKNLSADALKVTISVENKEKPLPESVEVPSMKPRSMSLLQKLVSEKESKFTVFTEEGAVEPAETALQGVSLCSMNDVIAHLWHIKMVNSQILLQGTETKGGVLVTAGNTTVLNRLHRPVWNKTELLNKKTWVGKLDNLQYFATVSPEDSVILNNIPWLDISVITGRQSQQKTGFDMADLANIVGSGEAVGGVVTSVVGRTTAGAAQDVPQLQRIVARCGCEFYFVNFNTEVDPLASSCTPNSVPQSPASNHLRVNRLPTVDTYTIRHKLLEISTNSSQYLMLIDIVNNVVLYTEPKKKEAIERLQKMTFRFQLSASEDQRGQILKQQNIVRSHQAEMRSLQRDLYELNLLRKQDLDNQELSEVLVQLERNISYKKELLNSASTELKLLISAYKDFHMNLNTPTPQKAPSAEEPTKLAEVHFNHVSWQLNQADGQLEIADVTFRNFSYSKTTLSDATIEHRFEVPKFHVRNLLPNSIYKDVLSQHTVSGQGHLDRAVMFRLYCRVKPPVAGIGIKEHLEVNVCPLSVGLTYRLFSKIMVFFFPQRAHEYETDVAEVDLIYKGVDHDEKDLGDDDLFCAADLEDNQPKSGNLKRCPSTASSISSSSDTSLESASSKSKKNMLTSHTDSSPSSPGPKDKGKKKSTFYRPLEQHDDLEKMKERASKNHSFIYVKVTQVLLCVSYKGEKEKNIVDVHNFNLTLPTLEYHNRTWTWHDLLIAMKKDCINVLVSQIIKEKLHLKGAHGNEVKDAKSQSREEDKAKLLFGDRSKVEKKKSKKSLLGKLVKKARNPKSPGLLQPDGAGPEPVDLEGEDFQGSDNEEEEPVVTQESQT